MCPQENLRTPEDDEDSPIGWRRRSRALITVSSSGGRVSHQSRGGHPHAQVQTPPCVRNGVL